MRPLLKGNSSRVNIYLSLIMVIIFCLALIISRGFASVEIIAIDGGGGSGGGGNGTDPEQEAVEGLLAIQQAQNAYFSQYGEYFASDDINEINAVLGTDLRETYVNFKTGDNPDLLGQADYDTGGYRIADSGTEKCYIGDCLDGVTGVSSSSGGGEPPLLADGTFGPFGSLRSSPVIADLDGDSYGELIVGSDDGNVYALDEDGTGLFDPSGIFARGDGSAIVSTPAIANIDEDPNGVVEVVVGTTAGNVYVWHIQDADEDGEADLLYQFSQPADNDDNIENSIVLEDIDNDNHLEIIAVGTWAGLYIWNHDGTPNTINTDLLYTTNVAGSPAVADLDNDSDKEVVIAGSTSIYVFDYTSNTFTNIRQLSIQGYFNSSPSLADIDGDGLLEILIGIKPISPSAGYLIVLNHQGSPVDGWPNGPGWWGSMSSPGINLGSNITSSVSVADLTNYPDAEFFEYDQDLEIVVGSEDGKLHIYHHDGTVLSGWPVDRTAIAMSSTNYDSSAAIADIDDDNDLEVIIGCWDGKLYGYDLDATSVTGFPKEEIGLIDLSSPSIGLLDSLAYLDVSIGDLSGTIYTWELTGNPSNTPWPKFRHDLRNTGTYLREDRTIPVITIEYISPSGPPIEIGEGQTVEFLVHASDPQGQDIIDISGYDIPTGASFTYDDPTQTATFTWTTQAGDQGVYSPFFIATDQYGLHSNRDVNIVTISVTNQPPDAVDDYDNTLEDTPKDIPVLDNDFDLNTGDTISIFSFDGISANGAIITQNGDMLRYTPPENYNNTDSTRDTFTYTITDGNENYDTAIVYVLVVPVNDDPIAVDDYPSTNEDEAVDIAVMSNDSDPDITDTIRIYSFTQPANGTVTDNLDGTLRYQPAADYNNDDTSRDTFQYTITDDNNGFATATVYVLVNPVPDAPVAVDDTTSTNEDTPIDIPVLNNDYDVDGDGIGIYDFTQPANGTVTQNGDFLNYAPDSGYSGQDTFTYRIIDNSPDALISAPATVTVDVAAIPDAPVITGLPDKATDEDVPLNNAIDLWSYTTDEDDSVDTLTFSITTNTNPQVGVSIDSNRYIDINPNANWNGFSDVTIRATDPGGLWGEDTFRITVNPVPDAPVAIDDSYQLPEDQMLVTLPPGVLENDYDYDNDPLTAIKVSDPQHGTLSEFNSDGSFSYTPDADWYGSDSFTYKAFDGSLESNVATVFITVSPVCDAPVAADDFYATTINTPVSGNVMDNDSDIDGDMIQVTSYDDSTTLGTVSVASDGNFTYTPPFSYIGTDSFTYTICDTCAPPLCDTATVTISISECTGPVRLYDNADNLIDCFDKIQTAINDSRALDGYKIRVDAGTYVENINFSGKGLTVESASPQGAQDTIINGNNAGTAITFSSTTSAATLKGFAITKGLTSGDGGGILINDAPVTITDCIVKNNQAAARGGGIACISTKPVNITNTDIICNTAGVSKNNSMFVAGTGLTTVSHSLIKQGCGGDDDDPACLLPGTKIQLANGELRDIEEIKKGDKVLGVSKDGSILPMEVLETFYHPKRQGFYSIETEDGNTLNVTGNHPIHNAEDFVEASSLKVGDEILVVDSKDRSRLIHSKIIRMIKEDSIVDVYNLEVDLHHNYIADGVVVHNKAGRKINIDIPSGN